MSRLRLDRLVLIPPLLAALAAGHGETARGAEPGAPPAAAPGGYLESIATAEDFEAVSAPSRLGGEVERFTKFLVPAEDVPELLPPLFQDVKAYPLHVEFLRAAFPDRFGDLDMETYLSLVERRSTRRYHAGVLYRLRTEGETFYGFSVFTRDPELFPAELLSAGEVRAVRERIRGAFLLEPLRYAPDTRAAREEAARWGDPGFPVYLRDLARSTFEAYTRGAGYGRVRILSGAELDEASSRGLLTWQDLLVLERAPSDIEGVVAGVVTAEPQGELSHVAIRTARRGTPNAYAADALERFAPLEGKLVRLEVEVAGYSAAEASFDEAAAWWEGNRPRLSAEPPLDPEYERLDSLEEIDLSGSVAPPEARFGGKASNLARLQGILAGPYAAYREPGFAIPVRHYLEFLRRSSAPSPLDPRRLVSYEEYLEELLSWDRFRSDAEVRIRALEAFREEIERNGRVDASLVGEILARIVEVFGSADLPVRFRSSSNVEDILEFNGAGLYYSSSACGADELDGDGLGPSRCDPSKAREQGIASALREVWASLWTFRAHEERSYYGIPPEQVAMGILVTRAFLGERANGVAFTGNPANALDRRYFVTSQVGEESVVSPQPGTLAEKDLLEVEAGRVLAIERARGSSLLPQGERVLSDEILRELGTLLWHIDGSFPVDLGTHRRDEVLLDVELKVEASGRLALKQVRPFLAPDPPPPGPTFELVVPPGTAACAAFSDGRGTPLAEYLAKSRILLRSGSHSLPTAAPSFPGSLLEEVLFGPEALRAEPKVPGRFRWRVAASAGSGGGARYAFDYREIFALPGGEELVVELRSIELAAPAGGDPAGGADPAPFVLDAALLDGGAGESGEVGDSGAAAGAGGIVLTAVAGGGDRAVRYASCGREDLPPWRIAVELEGGDRVELEERFLPPESGTGPAALVGAAVTLGGVRTEVRDDFRLVYAASRHNVLVRYWVVLDPPLSVGGDSVRVVEVEEPSEIFGVPARVAYLDRDFRALREPRVLCYARTPGETPAGCRFRRGDADSSGRVNLTDAVFILEAAFRGGSAPTCADAADFDDSGSIDIADAIQILSFLFRGADVAAPPGPHACGIDPTPDGFAGCVDASCR